MRSLLLVLITLNVCYLLWYALVLADRDASDRVNQPGRLLGDEVPSLVLRSERREGSIAASESETDPACHVFGPFRQDNEASRFAAAWESRFSAAEVLARQTESGSRYRVFLPPANDRESAAETLESLRETLVDNNLVIDTFLVPNGELANSVALGLFSEQSNALNVQEQVSALGYEVIVNTEPRLEETWWVRFMGNTGVEDAINQILRARPGILADAAEAEKLCETIAHDS